MIPASFLKHLDELRSRGLKCFFSWVVCFLAVYPQMDHLLKFLIRPVGHVVFTAPAAAFTAEIRLALAIGFLLASPVIFYQVWRFVSTALKPQEYKFVRIFAPLSFICFLAGAFFAYFVVIPFSLHFFLGFGSSVLLPMITVENYIGFFVSMLLAFGCVFEMPLILIFLTAIGIATPAFLIQKRKHALIGLLILSAVITPPDVFSMLVMVVPLALLYEIGIWASHVTWQKKWKDE